jgi:uncharacterized peroxidase-related enzyme
VYLAVQSLLKAIRTSLGFRRYELVTLAASEALGSTHCMLAHGQKSLQLFSEEQLKAIAKDFHDAGLSEEEVAMMDYAVKLCTDAASMTDIDAQRLRDLGLSDREIVDVTMAAAARNFISRSVLAMAVDLDVPRGMNDELKTALLEPLFRVSVPGPDGSSSRAAAR